MLMESCLLCTNTIQNRAVSPCGHDDMCGICMLRMRQLMNDKRCPYCKEVLEQLVILKNARRIAFADLNISKLLYDSNLGLLFETTETQSRFKRLCDITCSVCGTARRAKTYKSYNLLNQHLKSQHNKELCLICSSHHDMFSNERELFSSNTALQHHMNNGPNAHSRCKLCRKYCYDQDELNRHIQTEHFSCHLCSPAGEHVHFSSPNGLENHFRERHFLCETGDCQYIKFMVFNNELDFRAHYLSKHTNSQKERKRLARLDIGFAVRPQSAPHQDEEEHKASHATFESSFPTFEAMQRPLRDPSPAFEETSMMSANIERRVMLPFPPRCPSERKKIRHQELMQKVGAFAAKEEYPDLSNLFRSAVSQFVKGTLRSGEFYIELCTLFGRQPDDTDNEFDFLLMHILSLIADEDKRHSLYNVYLHGPDAHSPVRTRPIPASIPSTPQKTTLTDNLEQLRRATFGDAVNEKAITLLVDFSKDILQFGIEEGKEAPLPGSISSELKELAFACGDNLDGIESFDFLFYVEIEEMEITLLRNLVDSFGWEYHEMQDWAREIMESIPWAQLSKVPEFVCVLLESASECG